MHRKLTLLVVVHVGLFLQPLPAHAHGLLVQYKIVGDDRVAATSTVAMLGAPQGQGPLLAAFALFPGRTDRVEILSQFDDGTVAANALVTVRDAEKKIIRAGETNNQGVWSFMKPAPGEYQVKVDAGDGHVASIQFRIGDPNQPDAAPPAEGVNRQPETPLSLLLKIGIGLGLIGVMALALLLAMRQRQARKQTSGTSS
jgi:hypothetical protein